MDGRTINKSNSILIVDDEHTNIMALSHILRRDYTVYAEKTGADAIETAAKLAPDVILLDIMMPEMDGYTVLSVLKEKEETKDIPVILITGLGGVDNEERGLSLGAADYITKPFIPVIVKLRVDNQIKILTNIRGIIDKEIEVRKQKTKIDFLTGMSHDMLTPMNVIMGMTQILRMSEDPDKINECLDDISVASQELLDLLMELLNAASKETAE